MWGLSFFEDSSSECVNVSKFSMDTKGCLVSGVNFSELTKLNTDSQKLLKKIEKMRDFQVSETIHN
jgi:hypothetical protein